MANILRSIANRYRIHVAWLYGLLFAVFVWPLLIATGGSLQDPTTWGALGITSFVLLVGFLAIFGLRHRNSA